MNSKIRLTLKLGGSEIVIGDAEDGTPYRLLASGISGTEGADTALQITDYAQLDGGSVTSARVPGRELHLTFEIADHENREVLRDALISFFKPFADGVLTVSRRGNGLAPNHDRSIGCRLGGSVRMIQESMVDFIRVSVPLYCPDPYFYAESEPCVVAKKGEALLTFPLTLTEESGVTAGVLHTAKTLSVCNDGDTDTGFLLHITAVQQTPGEGAMFEHPCVTHLESGSYIRILDTLECDETLTICTLPGAKYILKNGERMMRFDRGSTFFTLMPGENTLVLSSGVYLGNMEAVLSWRTRHLGA